LMLSILTNSNLAIGFPAFLGHGQDRRADELIAEASLGVHQG
jgi:hypothetical protein